MEWRGQGMPVSGESTSHQLGLTRDTGQGRASSGIPSRTYQGVGQGGAVEQQLKGSLAHALCWKLFPRSTSPAKRGARTLIPAHTPPQPGKAVNPTDPSPPSSKGWYLVRSREAGPGKSRKQTAKDTITLQPRATPHRISSWEDSHQQGGVGSGWMGLWKLILASYPFSGGNPAATCVSNIRGAGYPWDAAPANPAMREAAWILEICHDFGLYLVLSQGRGSRPRHSPCSRRRTSSRAAAAAPGAG